MTPTPEPDIPPSPGPTGAQIDKPPGAGMSALEITVVACIAALLLGILLPAVEASGIFGPGVKLLRLLLFGWLTFPGNTWPRITPDYDGIAGFLATGAAIALLGHFFLRWLYTSMQPQGSPPKPWRARWTLAITLGTVLLFSLTVCASVVYHHAGWFLSPGPRSIEPKVVSYNSHHAFETAIDLAHNALRSSAGARSRGETINQLYSWSQPPKIVPTVLEHIEIGFVTRHDGSLFACFVIPRDPVDRANLGIATVTFLPDGQTLSTNQKDYQANAQNWPQVLKTLQEQAKASTDPAPIAKPDAAK